MSYFQEETEAINKSKLKKSILKFMTYYENFRLLIRKWRIKWKLELNLRNKGTRKDVCCCGSE
jgi:hypothetical protein